MPSAEIRPALIEAGTELQKSFPAKVEEILTLLRGSEPLQTITTLATFGLFSHFDRDGTSRSLIGNKRFLQAHVELVQALYLTLPPKELSTRSPEPSTIQALFDTLPDLSDAFAMKRLVAIEATRTDSEKAILAVQEHLRLHTQTVRNWGYFDRVVNSVVSLFAPLDSEWTKHIGAPITKIIECFRVLVRRVERTVNSAWAQTRDALRQRSIEEIVRRYYAVNPQFTDRPEDLLAFIRKHGLDLESTRFLILAHANVSLTSALVFPPDELAAAVGIDAAVLRSLLGNLSHRFGDLRDRNREHLFLDNPVWCKPFVRVETDTFFCAVPQMLFSFIRPIIDGLAGGRATLTDAITRRRAIFLEEEVTRQFAQAFPNAEIVRGYQWHADGVKYENDVIVRVDSHLFLVEAKSGSISARALRGAPERAKKHIHELILEPSIQSARLADRIMHVAQHPNERAHLLPGLQIDLEKVHTVVRLSVTLDDFATVQANLSMLKKTGWIPGEHQLAPCILLSDLEIIFDALQSEAQRLHYLRRRAEFARTSKIMGDELDFLGLYLMTAFAVGDAEFGGVNLQLVDMSKPVDAYYAPLAEGIHRKKPRVAMTKWWADLCLAVEKRRFPGWTDVCYILLSISPDEQGRAERVFALTKRVVRHNFKDPTHQNHVLIVPPEQKNAAIALYAFRDANSDRRHQTMADIAGGAFAHSHVDRCLVLGVNIDRVSYPYGLMALYFRDEATPTLMTAL